jgi:hypothetical protein
LLYIWASEKLRPASVPDSRPLAETFREVSTMAKSNGTRQSVQQFCRLEVPVGQDRHEVGVVLIVTAKKRASYTVARLNVDFGYAGFRISEIDPVGEQDHYSVLLAGPLSSCECLGFLHHGQPCKHIRSLEALRQAGKL